MRTTTRRHALLAAAAAPVALASGPALAKKKELMLDLANPRDAMFAYVKLRASTQTQDVYYWFTGILDIAVPGQPIKPIIQTETLILRRTQKLEDYKFHVTDWEATFYRELDTGKIVEGEIDNPVTGRKVRPLHYREGPVTFLFTENEPRLVGIRDVLPKEGKPFNYPWKRAGDDFWFTKDSYISSPHWLKKDEFPLETSGDKLTVQTSSTLKAKWADVVNPEVAAAPSDFSYAATSDWLPWMLMGQTPGYVLWHSSGKKLLDLKDAPGDVVETVRRIHPIWFTRPDPWPQFTNMYFQYKEQRWPAPKT
ncbi:MAG: DUF1838 family protein [Rhodospirillaceae bacterium]|nr:DUF1838 family protein [Rhodospirillaceae bacterium]